MEDSPATSPRHPSKSQKGMKGGGSRSNKKLVPLESKGSPPQTNTSMTLKIQKKKDLVEAVRRTNPAGVNAAPTIFWDVEGSLKNVNIDDSDVKQQLNIVESGVNYSAKRYNDLRVNNERYTRSLKKKLDELDEQKKNYESLEAMKNATTADGLRIEALQREINEVEEDMARKAHYTRQLEHVLQRLKKNSLKFDAHMTGMEEAMKAVVKEEQEVHLLRRNLDAGLAKAVAVLEETQANLATARKDREVLIAQRRSEVKNAHMLKEWLREREKQKMILSIELRGDLTRDEENFLKSEISDRAERTKSLQKANEESQKKLQAMEDAFAQTKQVTGVSSLEEMHEKFSSQKNVKKNLETEVKETEHKLLNAKKALQKKEKAFQELKSSGGGAADLTREMVNQLEEEILASKNDLKLTTAGISRLEAVLLGLQQGSKGLQQRVHPHMHLAEGGVFDLTQSDYTDYVSKTLDALSTAEHVLAKMIEIIAGSGEAASPSVRMMGADGDDASYNSNDDKSMSTRGEAPSHTNNIRIKSRKTLREAEMKADESGALDKQERGVPAGSSGNNLGNLSISNEISGEVDSPQRLQLSLPIPGNNAVLADDPFVPTRAAVKKSSERTSQEFQRKEELEVRRKTLAESMARGRAKGGATDDDHIAHVARLKAQNAMANRLCTIKALPTLPEGVTLRDDTMTKTNAFLTKMPMLE